MDNNNTPQNENGKTGSNKMVAFVLIVIGIIFLCRNLNFFPTEIIDYFASWPVILLVCGIYCFTRGRVGGGITLTLIGGYCYLRVTGLLPYGILSFNTIWPVILVIIGIVILKRDRKQNSNSYDQPQIAAHSVSESGGQVSINCLLSSEQQIIVEPFFSGGVVKATLGSVTLDLRRTALDKGETYLDIYCNFGGVELRVPDDWQIRNEIKYTMGGCEMLTPNRYPDAGNDRILVLRGEITFSGITIK